MIEGRGWVKLDGNEFAVAERQTVHIPRGSSETKVMADPSRAARAVRPMRCT